MYADMDSAEIAKLIEAIETAFAGVPRGAISLHEAEVIDSYGTEKERERARAYDQVEDWRDIPDASIEACPNALPHLDPVGWRFYLPACMRFSLRTVKERRTFDIDRVIYTLALYDDRILNHYARTRFQLLDAPQIEVVHRYLEIAATDDDLCDAVVARKALQRFWGRAHDLTSR